VKLGWVEERTGDKGTTFRARYHAPDGKVRSKSFAEWAYPSRRAARDAADAYLAKVMTEVRAGDWQAETTTTLGAWCRQWLDAREGITASTRRNYEQALKHLTARPAFANIPVQKVRAPDLQRLYATLRREKVGNGILRQLHVVINAALAQAHAWEVIRRNPARQVEAPRADPVAVRYWTPEQSAVFLQAESGNETWGVFWTLRVRTGMRIGEARALRWADVDLERRTVTITRTVTKGEHGRETIGVTTKTPNSRRTIPLPAGCVEPLKRHRVAQVERRLRAADWQTHHGDLVFTSRTGNLLDDARCREAFAAAIARQGLPELGGLHGLRHSFATGMLLDGTHPKVVAMLLGDTVEMVLKTYSHVIPGMTLDAMSAFDARIARIREELPSAGEG
jgi:integrase